MKKFTLFSFLIFLFVGFFSHTNAQVFFSQDFEGTMQVATDLPLNWSETGLSTDGIWQTGNDVAASSPYLTFPATSDGTQFAYTNDDNCNCDKSVDRLILPVQNFTGLANVNLSADVYINGGYGESLKCQVSTDGGATWINLTTYSANTTAWSNDVVTDLSAYDGMASITISFLYNDGSTWSFAAGVDDVKLFEAATEDLATISNIGEYTRIPLTQSANMALGGAVKNEGQATLTDVVLTAKVYLGGVLQQTTTSSLGTINPGDTLAMTTGTFSPLANGTYTVEYVATSATITDAVPTNDTSLYTYVVNDYLYSRDEGPTTVNLGVNGTGNTAVIGSLFNVVATEVLDSVTASHGLLTAGDSLQYEIYSTAAGLPTTLIGKSSIYIVTLADVNAGIVNPTVGVNDLSSNPLILAPGTYLVGAREFTTVNNGAISMTNSIFKPNTVFGSVDNGPWATIESLGFPNTPIIRPSFVPVCSAFTISGGMTSTDISCNGNADGTGASVPTGGTSTYTFSWGAGAGNQTTPSVSNLSSGTYYITITDVNGCSAVDSVIINEPSALGTGAGSTSSNVNCNGADDGTASIVATGGTPGYSYTWGASAGNQTTASVIDLAAGIHFVTITDMNGCTFLDSVIITEPAELIGSTVDNGDGTATASATGGTPAYSYLWDAAAGNQTTATTTALPDGSYTVTITDMNGCTTTETIAIVNNTSGINELGTGLSMTMYPNPAKELVTIELKTDNLNSNEVVISIYDFSGKMVLSNEFNQKENGKYILNIEELAAGIYTVNISAGNSAGIEKISIIK